MVFSKLSTSKTVCTDQKRKNVLNERRVDFKNLSCKMSWNPWSKSVCTPFCSEPYNSEDSEDFNCEDSNFEDSNSEEFNSEDSNSEESEQDKEEETDCRKLIKKYDRFAILLFISIWSKKDVTRQLNF